MQNVQNSLVNFIMDVLVSIEEHVTEITFEKVVQLYFFKIVHCLLNQ